MLSLPKRLKLERSVFGVILIHLAGRDRSEAARVSWHVANNRGFVGDLADSL